MARESGSGGFFRIDGPFVRIGNLVFDFIFLDILWVLISGIGPVIFFLYLTSNTALGNLPPWIVYPIIGILIFNWGPATTAMYYTLGKKQRGTDSYTFRDYFHAWKSNFKQAYIAGAIITIAFLLIGYNLLLLYTNYSTYGFMIYIIFPLEVLVAVELLFIGLYLFAMLARFEMSTKDLFRYSFFMANKHLPFTILVVAVFAACFALIYYVHIMFVFIVVSVGIYFQAALLERVFRNYMPDEDEELEKEDVGDFNINDERQAIINRYLGRSTENSALDEGNLVLVDKNGEEIKEEDYKVVKVEKDE